MKKLIIFLLFSVFAVSSLLSVTASAEYYNLKLEDMRSEAFLLVNLDTGTVVFSQNADERLKCASLVKTATAILVVENCENLDAVVTVSESAVSEFKDTNTASIDLVPGEQMSVRNLMYGMILENANDAANVLAEYIGGSVENFVKMMNELAAKLGCKNTNFTNPHGLDEEGEYSSAYDMYLLTKHALTNSVIEEMADTVDYVIPQTNMSEARELNTKVDIIESGSRYYYDYARGFKTGSTDESERCASVIATKNAYSYIGIVLGCPNECIDECGYPDNTALYEARRMCRWAFNNLKMTNVADTSDIITDIPVALSAQTDHVRLVPEKQIQALLLSTVDESSLDYVYDLDEDVMAPIEKGDVLGSVQIKYADSVVASVNLVAGDSVKRSGTLYIGYILKKIFLSPVFLVILAIVLIVLIVYIGSTYKKYKRQQRETRRRLREIKEKSHDELTASSAKRADSEKRR